jgi:nitroreductase
MAITNETIKILTNHSSVRDYTNEPVDEQSVRALLEVARAASSTCFLQVVTIIRITDQALKEKLSVLCGPQPHIAKAPEFWVFCADLHRNVEVLGSADTGWTEQLVYGCTDAAIAAQNVFAALESLGLGGVYAGGLRNNIAEVDKLLNLPQHVFPVVGLAFGHPASKNELKPRLPLSVTVCENGYAEPEEQAIETYDNQMRGYYANRAVNPKNTSWVQEIGRILGKERRPFMRQYLNSKGFGLK